MIKLLISGIVTDDQEVLGFRKIEFDRLHLFYIQNFNTTYDFEKGYADWKMNLTNNWLR